MAKPTLKEVATAAGVSPSSVSRYINNPTSIRPIPALRIERAIKELGYIPNILAQGLKGGHRNVIGVIVPRLGPYFSSVCSALSDFFYRHQFLLFICETHYEVERERFYMNSLISQQVAGIIIAPCGKNEDFFLDLHKVFPNILTMEQFPSSWPFDCVYEDSVDSAYQLTRHLLSRGHKQFILLFLSEFSNNTQYRVQGTRKALEEAGLKFEDMYTRFNVETEQLPDILSDFTQRTPAATAVIAYSPQYLESTLFILEHMGKRVPDDIAVAGYSVFNSAHKQRADIPTVIHDPYEVGVTAGDLVLRRLRKGKASVTRKEYLIKPTTNFPTS